MSAPNSTRRGFLKMVGFGIGTLGAAGRLSNAPAAQTQEATLDEKFFVRPEELTLRLDHGPAERRLSFARFKGSPAAWKKACRDKLAELLGLVPEAPPKTPPGGSVGRSPSLDAKEPHGLKPNGTKQGDYWQDNPPVADVQGVVVIQT